MCGDNQSQPGDPDFFKTVQLFLMLLSLIHSLRPSSLMHPSLMELLLPLERPMTTHESNVVAAGGLYYPEIFIPFAIKTIAARINTRNGLYTTQGFP